MNEDIDDSDHYHMVMMVMFSGGRPSNIIICLICLVEVHPTVCHAGGVGCTDTGWYSPKQCDRENGQCWCSTPCGHPTPGTYSDGSLSCGKLTSGLRNLKLFPHHLMLLKNEEKKNE